MRRRTALKALASASVVLSAGCTGSGDHDPDETVSGTTTETIDRADDGTTTTGYSTQAELPEPTCGDEWERVAAYNGRDIRYGTAGGFELTADPTSVPRGDRVTFRLTNRSDERRMTGIESKYDVHQWTPNGWQSILFAKRRGYEDLGVEHQPGEGFVWHRQASRTGLSRDGGGHAVRVCDAVRPGSYRFVYWGGAGSFDALGAKFEVTE